MLHFFSQCYRHSFYYQFVLVFLIYGRFRGWGFEFGLLNKVFMVGVCSWWGLKVWCGAFWVFCALGLIYKHRRIVLGINMVHGCQLAQKVMMPGQAKLSCYWNWNSFAYCMAKVQFRTPNPAFFGSLILWTNYIWIKYIISHKYTS